MRTVRTHADDPRFLALNEPLSRFLSELNGSSDGFYAPLNRLDEQARVLIVERDDQPIGCGAFRPHGEGEVEIKRMYVSPEARGLGLGRQILGELERWARADGYVQAVLETSRRLDAANGLYESAGYTVIPNYPPYEDAPDSVCWRKTLETESGHNP